MSAESITCRWLLVVVMVLVVACSGAFADRIIYVDDDATGANNGTSWTDAYTFLQDALADANSAEKPVEIRVAQGVYKPDQSRNQLLGERRASFHLINGVSLTGGYAGLAETDPNARNVGLYETILSGDLNGDDIDVNDPCDMLLVQFNRGDNSDHVVKGSDTNASAILDGFTITGGHLMAVSMGPPTGGAGMYIASGNPTIINCTFRGNAASQAGGGMYNIAGSPMLIDCMFEDNYAEFGAGMYNSTTMYLPQRSKPILINCSFSGNYSGREGGGMYNFKSDPNITNCVFSHNFALSYGAGIYNSYSNTELINTSFIENTAGSGGGIYSEDNSNLMLSDCVLRKNIAKLGGGGMCNADANSILLTNCLFSDNSAEQAGGGLAGSGNKATLVNCTFSGNKVYWESTNFSKGGGFHAFGDSVLINCTFCGNWAQQGRAISQYSLSELRLTNCILWDGGNEILINNPSTLVVAYNNIQGGMEGESNINADPCFVEPGYWVDMIDRNTVVEPNHPHAIWVEGDYHLKSQAGRWDPVSKSWVQDDVTSPCIDAGDPNSDWGDEVWPHGGRINMGAYGGTREASMSVEPQAMFLPRVAYIYGNDMDAAESFQALFVSYGCSTELIKLSEAAVTALDSYDLIVIGNDTGFTSSWGDTETVAAIEASGKPVVGIGEGGYAFFGKLGLSVGWPNGAHGNRNSIAVIDQNNPLFSEPYPIYLPEDGTLQLYTETEHVGLYLWPVPETVTVLGSEVDNPGYYPLALENDRYLLWGFEDSAQNLTETGKKLLVNTVIRTANAAWEMQTN